MQKEIKEYLISRGYDVSTDKMMKHINTWKQWYQGNVSGFHNYKIWNGTKNINRKMASLQLGKTVCETWANLLFNERCKIIIDDDATSKFVYDVFDNNNFWVKLNEFQEQKAAVGTVCYIPYAKGIAVKENEEISEVVGADGIAMNYIRAENLIPLSFENGVINELTVISNYVIGNEEYNYLQLFVLDTDSTYNIENHIFQIKDKECKKVSLTEVKGFEDVTEEMKTKSKMKPFVIDKPNIANNIDPSSPLGISVFANAIDSMKHCDIIFDSFTNEYRLGKKRIMVKGEAINNKGELVFDPNDLVFYQLPDDIKDEAFIKEIDMTIRSNDHTSGLQQGLNLFSSQCGLGENYYRYQNSGAVTATQVVSENNTMFRTLKKHEIILDAVLVDLIRLIIHIGITILEQPLKEDAEITIEFDDSIIEDKNAEMQRDLQLVVAGLMKGWEYRVKWLGDSEKNAKSILQTNAFFGDEDDE